MGRKITRIEHFRQSETDENVVFSVVRHRKNFPLRFSVGITY